METFNQDRGSIKDATHIKGWGIDADPKNDPTYPMKTRVDGEHQGYKWDRPEQQPIGTEVLHSNERPNVTAVYGTSVPPSGLSGSIRRFAFRYGEGSYGRWLSLLLADRINVLEGIADDLTAGRIPNICAEKGIKAQWKYDQTAVVKKAAVTAVVVAGVLMVLRSNKRH